MQRTATTWEPAVRIFHWLLALLIIFNLIFGEDDDGLYTVHVYLGYAALLLVVFRLIWGFIGSRHARFGDFVVGPGTALRYAGELARRQVAPHRGHTPLGGYMVVVLLLMVVALAVTGILAAQGNHGAEDIHKVLVNVMIALVVLHVLGVLIHTWRARENIIGPMLTGRKALAEGETAPPLVPGRRSALTAAAVVAGGAALAALIDLPRLASGTGEAGEAGEGGGEGEGGEGEGGEEGGG